MTSGRARLIFFTLKEKSGQLSLVLENQTLCLQLLYYRVFLSDQYNLLLILIV